MRVVRIQSRICVGGPALHSILLAEGLSYRAGSRYETTLLGGALEPGESSMDDVSRARGVNVETIPEMRRPVRPGPDLAAVARVTRTLRRVRPLIVHTHTAKAGAIGRIAARLARVPIVLHTFHGHVFDGYFSPRKTRMFLGVERSLAKITDRILAISEQQRIDLVDRYRIAPAHKVEVVPLGLDLGTFRRVQPRAPRVGVLRRELGIGADARVLVTVGRLVPIKRFDLLIEAFRDLVSDVPDLHLVIVGDGECRASLEAQAEDLSQVHFTGLRRDLPAIYGDADLMVLSSDNEGTPVAVIEAIVSGTPVVATDVGGVGDILNHGVGTVVPPSDARALAQSIRAHFQRPRGVDDACRTSVFKKYSHRRLIGDIEGLYDRLVEEREQRGYPRVAERPGQV